MLSPRPKGQKNYRGIKYKGSQKSLLVRIVWLWTIKNKEIQVAYTIEPKLHVRKHNKQFHYIIIIKRKNSVTVFMLPVLKILSIPTVEVLRWGQCSAAPFH